MLTMLAGNHDPFVSDHKHVLLAGDKILVTHGDVFHPAIAPWSIAARNVRNASIEGLSALEPERRDDLLARLAISHRASLAECDQLTRQASKSSLHNMALRPWALFQVLQYWREVPGLAARFAESCAPEAEYVICGHTHRQGVWRVGMRTIINTGSFGFPGRPRAVLVEGRRLEVRRIRYRGGCYEMAPDPLYEVELPEWVSMPSALNTRPISGRSSRAAI
jgi:UDP-2,3-diacylglucosamine pyrophosphatase LpxH